MVSTLASTISYGTIGGLLDCKIATYTSRLMYSLGCARGSYMKFEYLCIDFQNKLCQVSAHEFTRYQMELSKVRCDRFAYPLPPDARSECMTNITITQKCCKYGIITQVTNIVETAKSLLLAVKLQSFSKLLLPHLFRDKPE